MTTSSSLHERPAAVAGLFYPGHAAALGTWVDDALAAAEPTPAGDPPKALIVPHAGYVYSGRVAASAFARLRPMRDAIRRVVILGPCHRVPVRGLALPEARAFVTPLGTVPIDTDGERALAGCPAVVRSDAAHADEHALEVQLPFLQRVLNAFSIVPLAVGAASAAEVADVIDRLWGGDETLIVVSSDLSHYHSYGDAQAIDGATVRSILALDASLDHEQACGATPIAGLLEVARRRRLAPTLIELCNSGDTAGDKRRVVGYASFAFAARQGDATRDETDGRTLLALARGAIRHALGAGPPAIATGAWLDEPRATFVTLRRDGELRGCIGSLEPRRSLRADVEANARAAALADPRFPPLRADELPQIDIEVSLLTRPEPIDFADRDALFACVRPGVDGIVLTDGVRRATFLPQVWESLPDPSQFFAELARKAGIPPGRSLEQCSVQRYTVQKWTERDAAGGASA